MKYYAVVCGVKPGIYTDWPTTKSMVDGYSGAIFKSFATKEEAESFIKKSTITQSNICESKGKKLPLIGKTIIYTDGSFKDPYCGFGIVIIRSNGDKIRAYGRVPTSITEYMRSSNVAELYSIYVALSLVKGDIELYTDSIYSINCLTTYVHNWLENGWNNVANKNLIEPCYQLMLNRNITFQHVRGHSGVSYNEECDNLANLGRMQDENLIVLDGNKRLL